MSMSSGMTTYLEDGILRLWHDGSHTLYAEFKDTSYVKEIFKRAKGFVQSNARIGKFFRKLRLCVAPRWPRREDPARQDETPEYFQTRIMLVRCQTVFSIVRQWGSVLFVH